MTALLRQSTAQPSGAILPGMRYAACIAAALLGAASPAVASSTITCTSSVGPANGPTLDVSVGNGAAGGIFQARFSLGSERYTTGEGAAPPAIVQSWIDARQLKLEIADANAETIITRLDTRAQAGGDYLGTLSHRGRTWRVRCSEEG
jgi:hypothetical protein